MTKSELAELKALQAEKARLKRIVADQAMEIDALKEIQKGKIVSPVSRRRAVSHLMDGAFHWPVPAAALG